MMMMMMMTVSDVNGCKYIDILDIIRWWDMNRYGRWCMQCHHDSAWGCSCMTLTSPSLQALLCMILYVAITFETWQAIPWYHNAREILGNQNAMRNDSGNDMRYVSVWFSVAPTVWTFFPAPAVCFFPLNGVFSYQKASVMRRADFLLSHWVRCPFSAIWYPPDKLWLYQL